MKNKIGAYVCEKRQEIENIKRKQMKFMQEENKEIDKGFLKPKIKEKIVTKFSVLKK